MMVILKLFLLVLPFLIHEVTAQFPFVPAIHTSVAPITKHDKASLYSIVFNYKPITYLMDLEAPYSWYDCVIDTSGTCNAPQCLIPMQCTNAACKQSRRFVSHLCPPLNSTSGCSICPSTPVNPITKSCAISQLTYDSLHVQEYNGRDVITSINVAFYVFSCAPSSLVRSLPENVTGVAALSSSPLALPTLISPSYLGLKQISAICLPNSSLANGVIFFGDGPYYIPPLAIPDVQTLLSYTPLIQNSKSPAFYVNTTAIFVDGKVLPISLHGSRAKFSTIVPYTTLRDDIYKPFLKSFTKATENIPRARAIRPFRLCFKTSGLESTHTGFKVPLIDLEMGSGKNWTIYGANSMKRVAKGVACLAFLNGGKTAENAIVIGSFQMEDNFVLFDLENSRLGFSSSLLLAGTSCGNFNYTLVLG